MSDIFREVEEDVRRERYEQLWKKYGDYAIAGAAVLVLGAAGFQFWRYYEARERMRASDAYAAAEQMLESGQSEQAAAAFALLAKNAPSGYDNVAELQEADAMLAAGMHDKAVDLYKAIASGTNPLLASVARIRAGWALADTAPKSELETLLAPLTDPTSAWRFMAREILAYADYRTGNTKAALAAYESLAKDAGAPNALRQRCGAMTVFLKAGGDENYGTVPPPPAPVTPAPSAQIPAPATPATTQGTPPK